MLVPHRPSFQRAPNLNTLEKFLYVCKFIIQFQGPFYLLVYLLQTKITVTWIGSGVCQLLHDGRFWKRWCWTFKSSGMWHCSRVNGLWYCKGSYPLHLLCQAVEELGSLRGNYLPGNTVTSQCIVRSVAKSTASIVAGINRNMKVSCKINEGPVWASFLCWGTYCKIRHLVSQCVCRDHLERADTAERRNRMTHVHSVLYSATVVLTVLWHSNVKLLSQYSD